MVGSVDWPTESRLISATNSGKHPYADGDFFASVGVDQSISSDSQALLIGQSVVLAKFRQFHPDIPIFTALCDRVSNIGTDQSFKYSKRLVCKSLFAEAKDRMICSNHQFKNLAFLSITRGITMALT